MLPAFQQPEIASQAATIMSFEFILSAYGAIVATSALVLSLAIWLRSLPRLHISIFTDIKILGGDSRGTAKHDNMVTVTNRGGSTTVIQGLLIVEPENVVQKLRGRFKGGWFVRDPRLDKNHRSQLNQEIAPGQIWQGGFSKDSSFPEEWLNGRYSIAVFASHRDRPYTKKILKRKTLRQKAYKFEA